MEINLEAITTDVKLVSKIPEFLNSSYFDGKSIKITSKLKDSILDYCAAHARICRSEHSFGELRGKDNSKVLKTILKNEHHGPFGKVWLEFELSGVPKFGAMILNNERFLVTSEKSARSKKIVLKEREEELYQKWILIFEERIKAHYPFLDNNKIRDLTQENARYLTSVFTPTHMTHTISFRQLNYIMHWFYDFIEKAPDLEFNKRVKSFMGEFSEILKPFYVKELDPAMKLRELSIFAKRKNFKEEFGENYSRTYDASFAYLAQAHRHRTLNYEIISINEGRFFIPLILGTGSEANEWVSDMQSVADDFPQGTLITIHESGNYRDLISKMAERLCGQAQWEIMNQTKNTLNRYLAGVSGKNPEVHEELKNYSQGPRCTFPSLKCPEKCPFGSELGLERII